MPTGSAGAGAGVGVTAGGGVAGGGGAVGHDDEVDRKAVGRPALGRPSDGHQCPSGSDQGCGPPPDVAADDVEDQVGSADVVQGVVVSAPHGRTRIIVLPKKG